jgi:hypothetical protein
MRKGLTRSSTESCSLGMSDYEGVPFGPFVLLATLEAVAGTDCDPPMTAPVACMFVFRREIEKGVATFGPVGRYLSFSSKQQSARKCFSFRGSG